jgi:hypothetical protein
LLSGDEATAVFEQDKNQSREEKRREGFDTDMKEKSMNHLRSTAFALLAIGGTALIGSAASAQTPYGYGPRAGSYYSYGADRANPSIAPNGWDQDNPRDAQLQGGR